MATAGQKDPGALKTIGELSQELGVAQHILRYWETKFPQLRPMQRAGNRRYYRAGDVDLARRINNWLNHEGYTVRGVQKLLRDKHAPEPEPETYHDPQHEPQHEAVPQSAAAAPVALASEGADEEAAGGIDVFRLIALRNRLVEALDN